MGTVTNSRCMPATCRHGPPEGAARAPGWRDADTHLRRPPPCASALSSSPRCAAERRGGRLAQRRPHARRRTPERTLLLCNNADNTNGAPRTPSAVLQEQPPAGQVAGGRLSPTRLPVACLPSGRPTPSIHFGQALGLECGPKNEPTFGVHFSLRKKRRQTVSRGEIA